MTQITETNAGIGQITHITHALRRGRGRRFGKIFTNKEIKNFRRNLARRIRHLKSVQIELDRLPDVLSVRSSFRELQSEMDWARIQINVCGNMLKVRKADD